MFTFQQTNEIIVMFDECGKCARRTAASFNEFNKAGFVANKKLI